ncbi:hypothetical protein [Acidovorax cavernicola]|uniref:Uncharacterized protein n=1 Tax=Acidovorax cavernicola TaxID=1675792 RepID=A0A9X8GVS6_9BURK|nr:hypothetical protein [Acidovorax cavernicola]RIX81221.1 hypothetical protein D3H34_10840 [Acidovorax cavernicola]
MQGKQGNGDVQRGLQPVVELRSEGASYLYSVRAPRSKGVIPPSSYRHTGFASLPDCLRDVARALGGNFTRIYVRLEGHCVGERDIAELRKAPDAVAGELQAMCREVIAELEKKQQQQQQQAQGEATVPRG